MYEGNETFLLDLTDPVNCVLDAKRTLKITIEDESDGKPFN